MGLLKDSKKKLQKTKLHAHHSVQVEVPVHSLRLNTTNTKNGTKCTITIERGIPGHKNIAVNFASRLSEMGDDLWPHTNYVDHNVHKMRHIQIVCQNGFSQSGAR